MDNPSGERDDLPGSNGEHTLQRTFETRERALQFYDNSMHDRLTGLMQSFIEKRIMFFLATVDEAGHTDCSPRIGPQGFVRVLDDTHLAYPEFRGNGVHASLGNIQENSNATLLFIDWWESTVGLHVNGRATVHDELPDIHSSHTATKAWVELEVEEAYIHCAKHLPRLSIEAFDPPWGTDDADAKKSGFFADSDRAE